MSMNLIYSRLNNPEIVLQYFSLYCIERDSFVMLLWHIGLDFSINVFAAGWWLLESGSEERDLVRAELSICRWSSSYQLLADLLKADTLTSIFTLDLTAHSS